jgi:hypothetical protein
MEPQDVEYSGEVTRTLWRFDPFALLDQLCDVAMFEASLSCTTKSSALPAFQ